MGGKNPRRKNYFAFLLNIRPAVKMRENKNEKEFFSKAFFRSAMSTSSTKALVHVKIGKHWLFLSLPLPSI
jgi:hypothetical protein